MWLCGNIWITPYALYSYDSFEIAFNTLTHTHTSTLVFSSNTGNSDLLNKSNKNLCNESSSVIAQAAESFFIRMIGTCVREYFAKRSFLLLKSFHLFAVRYCNQAKNQSKTPNQLFCMNSSPFIFSLFQFYGQMFLRQIWIVADSSGQLIHTQHICDLIDFVAKSVE